MQETIKFVFLAFHCYLIVIAIRDLYSASFRRLIRDVVLIDDAEELCVRKWYDAINDRISEIDIAASKGHLYCGSVELLTPSEAINWMNFGI